MSATTPEAGGGATGAGGLLRAAGGAAFLTIVGIGLQKGIQLGSNLVMVRYLDKEAFGLMGIALTVSFAVAMLTDIGIASSIVRSSHGEDRGFLRTAWVTTIVRNGGVGLLVALIGLGLYLGRDAVPQDSIYAHPILPLFVAVAALHVIIGGFVSPSFVLAQRRMKVGALVTFEISSQLLAVGAMIGAAELGAGPWSLLIGALTGASAQVVFSHTVVPGPRMAFEWHREHFSEIFSFGKWLLLASAFGFVLNRGDQLIFGALFDADAFSLYVIASLWTVAAVGVAGNVMQKVCYPALSEAVRSHPGEVTALYRSFRLYADGAALLATGGLVMLIGPFFDIAYPDQYQGAVPFVRILALSLLLVPYRLINTVILSEGDSRRFTLITGLPAALMIVLLPAAYAVGGPYGAVFAYALIQIATLPLCWRIARRTIAFDWWTEARMLAAAGMGVTLLLLTS